VKIHGRTALLLVVPFVVVALGQRSVVPWSGDWIARQLRGVTRGLVPRMPRRSLGSRLALPEDLKPPTADSAEPPAPSANASSSAGTPRPAPPPPPKRVRITTAMVQHAIDDAGRTMRARTLYGPDGKPAGARIAGVNGMRSALRDGDVIVAVDGKPTMDDDTATDVALSAVARGERVLHATLVRDGQPFDVTLELPPAPR
jgi:hypothetical protein